MALYCKKNPNNKTIGYHVNHAHENVKYAIFAPLTHLIMAGIQISEVWELSNALISVLKRQRTRNSIFVA